MSRLVDPSTIQQIQSLPRIAQVTFLKFACPDADSDVKSFLEKGWSVWVTLKSSNRKLTGGTCRY